MSSDDKICHSGLKQDPLLQPTTVEASWNNNSTTVAFVTDLTVTDDKVLQYHNIDNKKDLLLLECYLGGVNVVAVILCNLFVVVVVSKSFLQANLQNIPNLLMLCLAVADLLTGVLAHPVRLVPCLSLPQSWYGGYFSCYVSQYLSSTLMTFSQYIVVCMSVERYLSLRKPFFYEQHCNIRLFMGITAVLLLCSMSFSGEFPTDGLTRIFRNIKFVSFCTS